jgi:dinuclear metal center YbgI/SA1388 family protein
MSVRVEDILSYLSSELEECPEDSSWNGLQVTNQGIISQIIGAVDASEQLFLATKPSVPSLYIVHHGMFWKGVNPSLHQSHYRKIQFLFQHDSALYASHLPLDIHPQIGNNSFLLHALSIIEDTIEPLSQYKGYPLGYCVALQEKQTLEKIQQAYENLCHEPSTLFPFGEKTVQSVAICSGDGTSFIADAYTKGVDLFITGEFSHTMYIYAQDYHMNVLCLTHYASEKGGVQNICQKLYEIFDVPFTMIDFSPIFS